MFVTPPIFNRLKKIVFKTFRPFEIYYKKVIKILDDLQNLKTELIQKQVHFITLDLTNDL